MKVENKIVFLKKLTNITVDFFMRGLRGGYFFTFTKSSKILCWELLL